MYVVSVGTTEDRKLLDCGVCVCVCMFLCGVSESLFQNNGHEEAKVCVM
jgi:hypothetical protein